MKRKGLAHAVILGGLLAFVTLFLTAFLWTCFQVPRTEPPQEREELISITTREAPSSSGLEGPPAERLVDETTPAAEEKAAFIPLPPPDHLIWLPRVPALVKVPATPRSLTVSTKPHVPDVPFLFEPMVLTEEEYDMFFPVMAEPDTPDEDFFADFFVVGTDSVVEYDDGLYYLGLYVNDDYVGDIEVRFEGEVQAVNAEELSLFIGDYITKDASIRLFGDNLDFLSIQEINERGIDTSYDSASFTVSMNFGLEDMPERSVSIIPTSINRREQYGMSGAIVLKPAKVSMASSLSLYTLFDYEPSPNFKLNNRLISLSVSNRLAIFGVGINFSFSVSSSSSTQTSFALGSWNGFYDFVEKSLRLSFGNVGSSLTNKLPGVSSSPFGFQLEKSYSYGTDRAKGNQFEYRIVLVEHSKVVISINGNEVFSRDFAAGTYRLKDFVFTQGANVVKIQITPTARPDDVTVEYVDMGYDYRLLGKGDTLYGFGITVPKVKSPTKSTDDWVFNLPWYNDQYLSYHLDKPTATYWQQIGVTNTFTFTTDVAFSPGVFSGTVNGVFASMLGTSQIQLTLGLDDRYGLGSPSFAGSISHRFSGRTGTKFGTVNVGVNFLKPYPSLSGLNPLSSVGGYISYSGNLTKQIRFTVSSSIIQSIGKSTPAWNTSFSTGFSPFKGMSLNGTIALSATEDDPLNPTVTAQITGSYSFSSNLSASASTSQQTDKSFSSVTGSSTVGISYRPTAKDNLNLQLSGFKFDAPQDHSLVAGWSHSGDLASFSLRQQVSNSYNRMTTTLTANTALAFADGAFALAKSVNEAFLIIRPVGELKKAEISVARSLDSSPMPLSRTLGSALYNNISTNAKNTVVVFSTGSTDYSTGASFVYEITPRSRQAFMARIDTQPSFTVSGVLLKSDKTPYEQYSSPVYSITTDENGQQVMTRDDSLYLFTDQDGRYILSDVLPGEYLFDLKVEELWYSVRFTVPEVEAGKTGKDRVLLLEQFWVADPELEMRLVVRDAFTQEVVEEEVDVFGTELVTGYDANMTLMVEERIDEETFWKIIFPPFEQDAWNFDVAPEAEDPFYFVEIGDQEFLQQQTMTTNAKPTQDATGAPPSEVSENTSPVGGQQEVEPGVDSTTSALPVPEVPSFSSVRVQSLSKYEEEQQVITSEKLEEDSSSTSSFPVADEQAVQSPSLSYSAP